MSTLGTALNSQKVPPPKGSLPTYKNMKVNKADKDGGGGAQRDA